MRANYGWSRLVSCHSGGVQPATACLYALSGAHVSRGNSGAKIMLLLSGEWESHKLSPINHIFAPLSGSDEREGERSSPWQGALIILIKHRPPISPPSATMPHTSFQYCVIIATSHCRWDKKGVVIKHMIGSRHSNHAIDLGCRAALLFCQQPSGTALGW